ncbi:MAG: hypothetical protein KDJ65_13715 [Anaerolineae bacterium]|nr:hypothetical protein [Anaerolineae bacterium]
MPPALWLIALPVGVAPIVYLLRRMGLGAIIAALITFLSAWLAANLPTGVVLNLLGRPIAFDPLSQTTLTMLFLATSVLYLTLTLLSVAQENRVAYLGKVTGQEGRVFYPAALIILGMFVAASLSRHLGITAIFIELAAILMVFVIQTQRLESTRAALRFLILISLATPIFLLAAWRIDVYQLSGGVVTTEEIDQTAMFVGLGFALWLAVVPFHGWLTSTATESSPITAAFVLITFPVVVFSTLVNLFVDLPWLTDSSFLMEAIVIAGVATAFVGGLWASMQRGFSELMGFAALYNIGCTLALLGVGGQAIVITVLVNLAVRTLALVLIAISTSTLYLQVVSDGFSYIRGMIRKMPFASAGIVIGGITLAGAPFTAGFAPYWQLLRTLAEQDPSFVLFLVLGSIGVSVGYLRGLWALLDADYDDESYVKTIVQDAQEPRLLLIIIVILMLVCIVTGLFPSLLIDPLRETALRVPLLIQ